MRITCIGTDPAALYLGVLLKRNGAGHAVRFVDGAQAPALPAALVCNPLKPRLQLDDSRALAAAEEALIRFDKIVVRTADGALATNGLVHASIDVVALRERLARLARELGCEFAAGTEALDPSTWREADVVVVADGAAALPDGVRFDTRRGEGALMSVAFATSQPRDALTYAFRSTSHGVFHLYAYPGGPAGATAIVEAPAPTLRAAGIEKASADEALAFCRRLFPDELAGATAHAAATWQPFVTVQNPVWHQGHVVLLGRAAYTAHFSVGLELRSWLEDAEALAKALGSGAAAAEALESYENARRPKAESLQRAAATSLAWFERVERQLKKPFAQFAFSLLTANMRLNYPRVAKAAPELARALDDLVAGATPGSNRPSPPPMFTPCRLRDLVLPNRIAVSPMCMYSAKDGTVNDFHLVHLGSRAMGGAGLVLTEMTDVLPEGRISLHCAGMYAPEHVGAWKRVVDFVHTHSAAKIGVQLAHAGRKGSLSRSWEGHKPLAEAKWEIIAPSPIPFAAGRQVPREMTRADMNQVRDAFARAAGMAEAAGFDMIELHYAHGYLMSSFISPVSNRRTDDYGGSLANRMRFPLEVFAAVRAAWPAHKPISTRISALDWVEGGTTLDDAIEIGRMLHEAGNDILAVSTGGIASEQRPVDGRVYQATFSDQIRNALGIPTMAVGGIVSHGDVNTIIAAGRADVCALARGYLVDPYFVRHAAHAQDYDGLNWPSQYRRAREVRMRGA